MPAAFRLSALVLLSAAAPAVGAAQTGFLDVDGARLYYEVEGQGPPLVFIHGWTHNVRVWDPQVPAFRSLYRVIRWDRRGFGKSTGSADETADPADLDALLRHLGVGSASLVGWSAGACVALAFALAYPEKVSALVLYGPCPPDGFGLPFTGPDSFPVARMIELVRTRGVAALAEIFADHQITAGLRDDPAIRARMAETLAAYSGADILRPVPPSGKVPPAHVDRLHNVRAPTLVLVGDLEMPYFKVVAEALAYGIPGARKVEIPGGGHGVSWTEPERFNAEVLRFLRQAWAARR